jgi:hypothetical protein
LDKRKGYDNFLSKVLPPEKKSNSKTRVVLRTTIFFATRQLRCGNCCTAHEFAYATLKRCALKRCGAR